MKQLRRVVWAEGMYLAPQHFQTQSRYLEDSLTFTISSLWFRPYGVLGLELDVEAIRGGTLALVKGRGVMPDGLAFDFPEADAAPAARSIKEAFSPTSDSHVLYLAIPQRREGLPNLADNGTATRFVAGTQLRYDEATGEEERMVAVGAKNFRFVLDTEIVPGLIALPIARIRRAAGEKFAFDDQFVPPVLDIAASPRLISLLRDLVGRLEEKSDAVGGQLRDSGQAPADYWRREISSFWFLHTIHASITSLRHLLLAKHGHPECLFRELSRLGGALCAFLLKVHPRDLPLYDHDRLTECFSALETHVVRHLDLFGSDSRVVTIPFQPAESYFWTALLTDQRLLDRSHWLLEVRSNAGEAQIISRAPRLVKVCAEKFIRELVRRAIDGLPLRHVTAPPPQVPQKVDAHYFSVSKEGPCWDQIVRLRQVGLYVPGDFPGAQVNLIVLLED